MYTQKEILRDTILTGMKPYLDAAVLDILNQVVVQALFDVEVTESQTLPATRNNTNEHILQLYMTKKAPKLSPKTVNYYLLTIRRFSDYVDKSLLDVTDMDVECYLQAYARKGNQASTVNNERRNLSAFYTWARKSHLVNDNPVDGVEPYKTIDKPIEYMEDWEMEAMRDACKLEKSSKVTEIKEYRECLRDRALIEFLRSTAVRVSECASVDIRDIDWQTGELVVYGQKTRSYRTVCLDDAARYHVRKYIDSRRDNDPALFASLKAPHNRLTKSGIESAIKAVAIRAGLKRRVYPHLFRKTTATNMTRRGCPRELIALYLGHKNGNTRTLNAHYAATDQGQVLAAFRQYGAAA
ncbi:tyrosine-type recombinase/integrase [Lachnospiraceae bacterium KGMB03038]|nr:tyrosine-type recombinase/integrase [Lachnospiraceae bacterium KGMB03038]